MMTGLRLLISMLLTSLSAPNLSWAQHSPDTTTLTDSDSEYAESELSPRCLLRTNITNSNPGFIYIPTYYPTAPNTLADCVSYRNYSDPTNLFFDVPDKIIKTLNSCKYIANSNRVTMDQLMEWNPSLSGNVTTCALQPGYSYCVLKSEDSGEPQSLFFQICQT
ncbi:hypothetical protein N7528_002238 [Penicillium herquei]|nr:hypothetical protein N7528_002238 [Penicillium herquei]